MQAVDKLFREILIWTLIYIAVLAVAGSLIGYLVAGTNGLISALIAAGLGAALASLTIGSILLARKLDSVGFMGTVLFSWLAKMVLLIGVLAILRDQPFIHQLTLFFTLLAALLGSVAIDVFAVLRSRITVDPALSKHLQD